MKIFHILTLTLCCATPFAQANTTTTICTALSTGTLITSSLIASASSMPHYLNSSPEETSSLKKIAAGIALIGLAINNADHITANAGLDLIINEFSNTNEGK